MAIPGEVRGHTWGIFMAASGEFLMAVDRVIVATWTMKDGIAMGTCGRKRRLDLEGILAAALLALISLGFTRELPHDRPPSLLGPRARCRAFAADHRKSPLSITETPQLIAGVGYGSD